VSFLIQYEIDPDKVHLIPGLMHGAHITGRLLRRMEIKVDYAPLASRPSGIDG
jgi:hypothetical protein